MNIQTRTLFPAFALLITSAAFGAPQGATQPGAQGQPPAANQAPAATPQGNTANTGAATQASNPILSMKAGEISGREIYNTEGKELGKVDMIGRDRNTGTLSAIVSVGGFLGFGGSKVAIPVEQLSLNDDKLILSTAMSKKELRRQASGYQSRRYEAVAEDTTLSQVAPTAGASAGAAAQGQTRPAAGNVSFEQLDTNHDGYIERNEATAAPSLLNAWRQADQNHDGRIDQSEFSSFEQSQGQSEPRPSGDNMREREGAREMPSR